MKRTDIIVLSKRDTERVVKLLENPPKPTKHLIAAARRYLQNQAASQTPLRRRKKRSEGLT